MNDYIIHMQGLCLGTNLRCAQRCAGMERNMNDYIIHIQDLCLGTNLGCAQRRARMERV